MDVTALADGRLVVALGGVVYNNCSSDYDCPGWALCYINATWSSFESMCACDPTNYGLGGADCRSFTAGEIPLFLMTLVSLAIDFYVALAVMQLLYGLCYHARRITNHTTTLCFDLVASLAGIAVNVVFLTKLYGVYPRAADGKSEKDQGLDNIAFACFFAFSSFAALNVSQTWARVAIHAKRMSDGVHSRYERILTVYFVVFVSAMIAMFALGMDTLVIYMCIPAIAFIVAAYGWASFTLEKILKQSLAFAAKHGSSSQSKDDQVAQALKAVAVTARQLSALAVLTIVFIVADAVIGHTYDRPGSPVGWSVLRMAYLMGSLINLVVLRYISVYVPFAKSHATVPDRSSKPTRSTDPKATRDMAPSLVNSPHVPAA